MKILAVDPGSEQSAWVLLEDENICGFGLSPNKQVCNAMGVYGDSCVIEYTKAYTMAVKPKAEGGSGVAFFPQQVLDTAVQIGRFMERWELSHPGKSVLLMSRRNVKMHLCGSMNAKDAQIREAMIDRWGGTKLAAVGLKKTPGPLYGFKKDLWAALAVAVTYRDTVVNPTF